MRPVRRYEKPKAVKQEKMTFTTRYLPKPKDAAACRQCSSCHGCR